MNIQSLSVVVPNKKCINDCKFCVSKMHTNDYENRMCLDGFSDEECARTITDYKNRLEFARDNGCNVVILTGSSEPQQNKKFLKRFGLANESLKSPFKCIEMQTTGVLLDYEYLEFLRNEVGVTTISLSLSSLNNEMNCEYNGTVEKLKVSICVLCSQIKDYGFILRLSLNMTDYYNDKSPSQIFHFCKKMCWADQVTLRVLYGANKETTQGQWILEHSCNNQKIKEFNNYVVENGNPLETLPYGAVKYSLHNMSIVIDNDCMAKKNVEIGTYKYLILRENCRLYSRWDDDASLIF